MMKLIGAVFILSLWAMPTTHACDGSGHSRMDKEGISCNQASKGEAGKHCPYHQKISEAGNSQSEQFALMQSETANLKSDADSSDIEDFQ